MKNLDPKKTYILIATGMSMIVFSRLVIHYTTADSYDLYLGALSGAGIGLLVAAIMNGRFRKKRNT
ncbi:hypothetical protein [Christiangramia sp. SM2212]|uniref:Uncharacterized protein n=1 Tax=Christiangramia sediminicola TaxID=3073267 RepID=A0ABU1ELY8_9FLAO|nr:hypothetical protein [Christiangramia sp. SM2212]MDR5589082.1 hypothetical protein [Christiangramia sp. SM2212]